MKLHSENHSEKIVILDISLQNNVDEGEFIVNVKQVRDIATDRVYHRTDRFL